MVRTPAFFRDETVCDERLTEVTRAPLNLMYKRTGNRSAAAAWSAISLEKKA